MYSLDFRQRSCVSFDVKIEELRALLDPEHQAGGLSVFCGCSLGYMREIESVTYSVGPESFGTSVKPYKKSLSWNETSRVEIAVPSGQLASADRTRVVRSLAMKVISL